MTNQTWVAALAPRDLTAALAGPASRVLAWATPADAKTNKNWGRLRAMASATDLHPDSAAILAERATHPGMFALAGTLLLAGHATSLAALAGPGPGGSRGGTVYPQAAALGARDLASWFGTGPTDWDDVLAALASAETAVRTTILSAYLTSGAPDGDLLDAIAERMPHLLAELDALLADASRWDARTGARLVGAVLPHLDGPDPFTRKRAHGGTAAIPDAATWASLTHELGVSRLTFALGHPNQDVPANVVPGLVDLARAHSPELMWALVTHEQNLHADLSAAELSALACGRAADLPSYARGNALLSHYGALLGEGAKAAILSAALLGQLAGWCASGALGVADAPALRAALAAQGGGLVDMLRCPEVTTLTWDQVSANPLLIELMLGDPGYLQLLQLPRHSQHPGWALELNAAFRARAQRRLGRDLRAWRAFTALMETPGGATTDDLFTAALSVSAPARG